MSICLAVAGLLPGTSAPAAEADFTFKVAYRHVSADPEGIWGLDALSSSKTGQVSIFEYELRRTTGSFLVSQIWNDDCTLKTCPTRLVWIPASGRITLLLEDMMYQVNPPNDPKFGGPPMTGPQVTFQQHPFRLSAGGTELINDDFKFHFPIERGMQ